MNSNKEKRYYVDIDPGDHIVIGWGTGDRFVLSKETLADGVVRIYITRGQYNKLILR